MDPQQPYISFQNSLVGRALQNIGGKIGSLFQPQQIQSPIPTSNIVASRPQIVSPIPSQDVLPNLTSPSPIQQALDMLDNVLPKGQETQAQNMQAVKGAADSLSTTPTPSWSQGFVMNTPDQYIPTITDAAKKYNVPTNILSGALANESMQWNPDVISGKLNSPVGAKGIAQFMPDTAKGMGIDPLNADQAIQGMAKLLASHKEKFGSWENALAAYNAGPGNVAKYGGIPPFSETQNYVKNIMLNAMKTFKRN